MRQAAARCAEQHLDRIIHATTAPLVVIVGAHARDRLKDRWTLPAGFGQEIGGEFDETANIVVRQIGDRPRVVAFLWHTNAFTGRTGFANTYFRNLTGLRDVAAGRVVPSDLRCCEVVDRSAAISGTQCHGAAGYASQCAEVARQPWFASDLWAREARHLVTVQIAT